MDKSKRKPPSKNDYQRRSRSPRSDHDVNRRRSRSSSSSDSDRDCPKTARSSVDLKPVLKSGIKLKLVPAKSAQPSSKITVASAFNNDSDEEVELMPPEAKMRMRNIGKNTPTSAGPNSFGKTKEGFVDSKKMFEKKMQQMLDLE